MDDLKVLWHPEDGGGEAPSARTARRRPARSRLARAGSTLLALTIAATMLVADVAAMPLPGHAGATGVRQVSSYEQGFNPFGDPWSTKAGQNPAIPIGQTSACHRRGEKANNLTPNPEEVAVIARSNNLIVWEECGDPMEASGGPQRNGDPVLKNFVTAVKQANPAIKYIGYIPISHHNPPPYGETTAAGAIDFDPIEAYFIHKVGTDPSQRANRVKSINGAFDLYDVTNPQWRQDMANHIKTSLAFHGMDGIVVDACFDQPQFLQYSNDPNNPNGPAAATRNAWQQGCLDTLTTLKQTMPDKLIFFTGYLHLGTQDQPSNVNEPAALQFYQQREDVADGLFWEDPLGSVNYPQVTISSSIQRYQAVRDYAVQRGKYLVNIVNTNAQGQSSFGTTSRAQQLQLERYYLAGQLTQFANDKTLMALYTPTPFGDAFYSDAFFTDWDWNIGSPLGAASQPSAGVYRREFQQARVVWNTSDGAFTIDLSDGTFRTLDGQQVASYQLPAKSGMIFLKPGSQSPPEQTSCTPRPPVTVSVAQVGDGQLQVNIHVGQGGGFLHNLQILETRNATIDIQGGAQGVAGNYNYAAPIGATSAQLTIRRVSAGAMHVPMIVTDGCGDWRTFAGAGIGVR
ncbi:MAG: hypothetical protein IT305_06465 [Chloroflexi bacterium]|nr:hypothetical protein [Chloroflexota bacterium]